MRLPEKFVSDLRSRVRIDTVIADYVDLKSQSTLLVGLCPFHSERTPSFKVRPEFGRYHCYGCGAGGDVFDFLQQADGLSFREAVERVAAAAGVPVPSAAAPDDKHAFPERAVRAALSDAHTLYQEALHSSAAQPGRSYLLERRFTDEQTGDWGVGYSPLDDSVISALRARHSDDVLTAAGLIKPSQRSRGHYDPLRGRLVWPLHDKAGRICGFAGRDLTGNSKAKYLNSDESSVYRKRGTLFGLWKARRSILTTRSVIVAEGYTDVMAFAAAGHHAVVATCGTAFTAEHADLVAGRVGDEGEVISAFDNDVAGRNAAWALFLQCQKFTSQITAVDYSTFGNKADACQARTVAGDDGLTALVSGRVPVLRLLVAHDCAVDVSSPESVAAAARSVTGRLRQVVSPILRRAYLEEAASHLRITVDELTAGVSPPPPVADTPQAAVRSDCSSHTSDEVAVAAAVIARPSLADTIIAAVQCGSLRDVLGAHVFQLVELSLAGYPQGRPFDGEDAEVWGDFMREVIDPEHHDLLWQVAFADLDDNVADRAMRLRRLQLIHAIEETRSDPNRADDYMTAYRALRDLRTHTPAVT